jgi:hypothetical protein
VLVHSAAGRRVPVNIPIWPGRRLAVSANVIKVGPPRLAIHSNITPGKLGPESLHILMLDFDERDAGDVQETMRHGGVYDYFLLQTEHGFHVVDTTARSWATMRVMQINLEDHDLHTRKTAQYGRAALALHPYKGWRVGHQVRHKYESAPHHYFYEHWIIDPSLDWAKSALAAGDIAFRLYNKFEVL